MGKTYRIGVSADGKITKAPGLNSTIDEVTEGLFDTCPPGPVAVGERWSTTRTNKLLPVLETTYFKITDRRDGADNIKVYCDIKPNRANPTVGIAGMTGTLLLSGNVQGYCAVDEANGLITSGSTSGQLSGTCDVTVQGKRGQGQCSVSSTSTIERFIPSADISAQKCWPCPTNMVSGNFCIIASYLGSPFSSTFLSGSMWKMIGRSSA